MGLELGYIISKVLDKGVIELIGPFGLSNVLNRTALSISRLDTGVITTYSLYITLGLLSLILLVFSPLLLDTSFYTSLPSASSIQIDGSIHTNLVSSLPNGELQNWVGGGEQEVSGLEVSLFNEIRLALIFLTATIIVSFNTEPQAY